MKISLTKILQIVNFTSLILTWYLFITEGGNEYINLTSVILCTILSIQAYLFLKYADKQNNPLIFILSFQLVIYYVIRICTLLYVPYSMVFLRLNAIDFNDCNYTLIFIILSNGIMKTQTVMKFITKAISRNPTANYVRRWSLICYL